MVGIDICACVVRSLRHHRFGERATRQNADPRLGRLMRALPGIERQHRYNKHGAT
jgi:hypothetical protein